MQQALRESKNMRRDTLQRDIEFPALQSQKLKMLVKKRYQYLLRKKNSQIKKMALEKQELIREKKRMVDVMLGVIPVGQLDIARVVNKPDDRLKLLASEIEGLKELLILKNQLIDSLTAKQKEMVNQSLIVSGSEDQCKSVLNISTSTCDLISQADNSTASVTPLQHDIDEESEADTFRRRNQDLTAHIKCLQAKIKKQSNELDKSVNFLKECQARISQMEDAEARVKDHIQSVLNLTDLVTAESSIQRLVQILADSKPSEVQAINKKVERCWEKASSALCEMGTASIELNRCQLLGEELTTKTIRFYLGPVYDILEELEDRLSRLIKPVISGQEAKTGARCSKTYTAPTRTSTTLKAGSKAACPNLSKCKMHVQHKDFHRKPAKHSPAKHKTKPRDFSNSLTKCRGCHSKPTHNHAKCKGGKLFGLSSCGSERFSKKTCKDKKNTLEKPPKKVPVTSPDTPAEGQTQDKTQKLPNLKNFPWFDS